MPLRSNFIDDSAMATDHAAHHNDLATALNLRALTVVTKTAAHSAAAGEFVLADVSGGTWAVTLPTNPAANTVVGVKKTDGTTNVVTLVPSGTAKIDGNNTCTLVSPKVAVLVQFDGTNWQVQATALPNTGTTPATSVATDTTPVFRSQYWYDRRIGGMTIYTTTQPTLTANTVYYQAVYSPQAIALDTIACHNFSGTAGSMLRFGLYAMDSATGAPTGAPIYDLGAKAVNTGTASVAAASVQWSGSVTLPKGWSYMALSVNGTAPGTVIMATGSISVPLGFGMAAASFVPGVTAYTNLLTLQVGYWTQTGDGTLPTAPAVTPVFGGTLGVNFVFKVA